MNWINKNTALIGFITMVLVVVLFYKDWKKSKDAKAALNTPTA